MQENKSNRDGPFTIHKVIMAMIVVLSLLLGLFHIYTAGFGELPGYQQRAVHLMFVLILIFLYQSLRKGKPWPVRVFDLMLAAAGGAAMLYAYLQYPTLVDRAGLPYSADMVVGCISIILILEATRRVAGPAIVMVAGAGFLYTFFGDYLPGILGHPGISAQKFLYFQFLSMEGIFGMPLGVSASFIVLFILFTSILNQAGAGPYYLRLAQSAVGHVRGGPAKIAVISSALFGSISGSAVANVVGTGSFTIPLMKRLGYKPSFAGAVEATASTGGQIMPPVMGAAAFVMAEMLGKPYSYVMRAAIIPALLYYLAVFVMVDLEAVKQNLKGVPRSSLPPFFAVLKEGWHYLFPLALLLYLLVFVGFTATKAAFYSILIAIAFMYLRKISRLSPKQFLEMFRDAAESVMMVAATCATAGLIVGVFTITGLGMKLSALIVQFSGGSLLLLMVLSMVASFILGMGMPTTACYIILAILVAPAMVHLGVVPIAAHLFVFYFGVLSNITPPVALAAFAAAGIAGSSPMTTGWTAVKMALAAFIVPYMFVYGPALVMEGSLTEIGLALVSSIVGTISLACGVQGIAIGRTNIMERACFLIGAPFLMIPGLITDLIGYGFVAAGLISQFLRGRAAVAGEAVTEEIDS